MATYNASQGLIKVAGNTLGELKSFSFSRTATTIETSNMASSAMTYAVGKTSFSGSAEAFWDNDDTGQNALTEGTLLEIHFYSEGAASAAKYHSGNCIVTEISTSLSTDGQVEASFSFTGTGVLTEMTVT